MTIRLRTALVAVVAAALGMLAILVLDAVGLPAAVELAVAGGVLVMVGIGGWLRGRSLAKPLRDLTEAAEEAGGSLELGGSAPTELRRLAAAINRQRARLEEGRRRRHHLLADLAHELRTPATALRSNLETLATRSAELKSDERATLIEAAHAEGEELVDLLEQLIDLAIDAAEPTEPETPVDLADLAHRVADRFRRRSGRHLIVITVDRPEPVSGRVSELERAVSNLVDNALKWGPDDTPVEVVVSGRTLTVSDHGPGIPPEDLSQVFERFYRSARDAAIPGSGLGLAIVAEVVTSHRGQVLVRNHPDSGAKVGFTLPSARVG